MVHMPVAPFFRRLSGGNGTSPGPKAEASFPTTDFSRGGNSYRKRKSFVQKGPQGHRTGRRIVPNGSSFFLGTYVDSPLRLFLWHAACSTETRPVRNAEAKARCSRRASDRSPQWSQRHPPAVARPRDGGRR